MEGMVSIDLWPHPDLFGFDRFVLLFLKSMFWESASSCLFK